MKIRQSGRVARIGRYLACAILLWVSSLSMGFAAGPGFKEFRPIQPVSSGSAHVIEFFWYGCPHCYQIEKELTQWLKTQQKRPGFSFQRIPAPLNKNWTRMARAYYALEAMGRMPALHVAIFKAIHEERLTLTRPNVMAAFLRRHDVNVKEYRALLNSFSVDRSVRKAARLSSALRIESVPAFAVNYRYVSSVGLAGSEEKLFNVLSDLVRSVMAAR